MWRFGACRLGGRWHRRERRIVRSPTDVNVLSWEFTPDAVEIACQ